MSAHYPKESPRNSVDSQGFLKIQRKPRRPLLWISVITAMMVVLGLTLGLGLGLGLKHKSVAAAAATPSPTTTASSSIKNVPRSALVDPAQFVLSPSFNVHAAPQARVYNWTLSEIISDPTGTSKSMLAVNNLSPGPTIEANLGDQVIVHVTNTMPNSTSIHWHGQSQNGTNFMDGTYGITECGIAPGSTYTYNWTVQNVGTYWWHAHYSTQYTDGLFGALILHSPNDTLAFINTLSSNSTTSESPTKITYDEDLIFIVGDTYNVLSGGLLAEYLSPNGIDGTQGDEPVADGGLVNGYGKSNCAFAPTASTCDGGSFYNFTVKANKRYRMRVINAGTFADIRFSVDGHVLQVVEADGTPIVPQKVQSVTIAVAQRYSVIIETNQTAGAYYVRGEVMTDMFTYDNPALVTEQNAIMRYSGISNTTMPSETAPPLNVSTQDLDTNSLVPYVVQNPPKATKSETVFVNFELTSDGAWGGFFNGTAWAPEKKGKATVFQTANASITGSGGPPSSQYILTNTDIQVLDLIINNQDDGDHPFHLHGHTPWLIGAGEGNYQTGDGLTVNNPMRRDVFVIPAYTWVAIRFITDNPGMWALHCHIAWHMEAGLLMQFANLPSKIGKFSFPPSMQSECRAVAASKGN